MYKRQQPCSALSAHQALSLIEGENGGVLHVLQLSAHVGQHLHHIHEHRYTRPKGQAVSGVLEGAGAQEAEAADEQLEEQDVYKRQG